MNILFESSESTGDTISIPDELVLDLEDADDTKKTTKATPKAKTESKPKPAAKGSAKPSAKSTPKGAKTVAAPSSVSADRKNFEKKYDAVLKNVDMPNGGVTLQMLRAVKGSSQTANGLEKLTKKNMRDVVYESVWKPGSVNTLPENVQAQFLDMNMVHEPKEAVRILQRAINAATPIPSVSVDGIMRKGVASAATRTIAKDVNILKAERCLFYAEEIRRKPNQKQFWVRRFTRAISLG